MIHEVQDRGAADFAVCTGNAHHFLTLILFPVIPSEARFTFGVSLRWYGFSYFSKLSLLPTGGSTATSLTPHIS